MRCGHAARLGFGKPQRGLARAPRPARGGLVDAGRDVAERQVEAGEQRPPVARGRRKDQRASPGPVGGRRNAVWLLFLRTFFDTARRSRYYPTFSPTGPARVRGPGQGGIGGNTQLRVRRSVAHDRAGGIDGSSRQAFDAWDLAARRGSMSGTVAADALPTIADRIAGRGRRRRSSLGVSKVRPTRIGRPALSIAWKDRCRSNASAACGRSRGRCGRRRWCCSRRDERELVPARRGRPARGHPGRDALDPVPLVEDELLLTLPFAPHCERADCVVQAEAMDAAGPPNGGASPFAALGALKSEPRKKPR